MTLEFSLAHKGAAAEVLNVFCAQEVGVGCGSDEEI
jgi:hypothetical protein